MKRWPTVTLGEVAGGGQYGLNAAAMTDGTGIRFVRITDITPTGELRHEEPAFVPAGTAQLDDYELEDGDVLIARSGATAGKSYVHQSFGERAVFAGYLIRFKPDTSRILPRYIGAFLQTPDYWRQLNSHKRAVAQPNVNAKQLASLELALPPVAEQVRIVNLVDEASELRKLRAQADRRTTDLIPALFHEMFGDPSVNREGHSVQQLEGVCSRITDGTHQPPAFAGKGIPFLFVRNIVGGVIDFDTEKFITEETFAELTRRVKPERGDILYSTVGSYGVAVQVETDRKFAFQRHIGHLKPNHQQIDSGFLTAQLNTPWLRSQAAQSARGIAQQTVNLAEIRKFKVLVPPLALQKRFAALVAEIRGMETEQATSSHRLEDLFQSLLHRAFRGEL